MRRRPLEPEALQGLRDLRQADVHPEADGGEIQALRERVHQRHRTIGLVSEVLRPPLLAVGKPDLHRLILDDARRVVAPGLEGCQVDEGLDQRAHRPPAIQGAIEAIEGDVAPADDGDDVAALGRRHDDRAFERGTRILALVQPRELAVQSLFGLLLRAWLEARVNPEARLGEVFLAIVAA